MRLPSNRLTRRLAIFGLAATATTVLVTSVAAGGPLDEVLAALGVIDDNVDSLVETQAEQSAQLDALATAVAELAAQTDVVEVEIMTWENACGFGFPSACITDDFPEGHGYQAASSANHNPLPIVFHVTRNGEAVDGLVAQDVDIRFPTGVGPAIQRCDDGTGSCGPFYSDTLLPGTFGIYVIWVHPVEIAGNWNAGNIGFAVRVEVEPGVAGYGFGEINIPE